MSDDTDPLLARLAELPARSNAHDPEPAARQAFDDAFVPWHQRTFVRVPAALPQADGTIALVTRSIVPLLLAGVVAIYLLWAISAVLAVQS